MNPFSGTDAPDIIVLRTDQNQGPWLVYQINIKGNIFEVAFRCPCGYQPADVQRTMGIAPQERPATGGSSMSGGSSSVGSSGNPGSNNNSGNPGGPGNKPDQPGDNPGDNPDDPHYDKGIENSSNSGSNQDSGPGPDTNNGVGADMSAADSSNNSGSGSYDEYHQNQENLADANKNAEHQQQTNNGSSYTPPSSGGGGISVDNNANTGNGYGSVNDPSSSDIAADPAVDGETAGSGWTW